MATPVITKNARVTGPAREKLAAQMRKKYERGATVRDLHAETGRSFGAIQKLLAEAGATMRPRGGARK
jgi:hypothetical protein